MCRLHLLPGPYRRFDHLRTLPQGNGGARPAFAGGAVRRHRYLEILDAGQMLENFLPINRPHVGAVQEVSSIAHGTIPRREVGRTPPGSKGG
jgi:hypothetical protein